MWDFSTTGRTKKSYTAVSGYREPDRVTSYDKSTQLPKNEAEYDQTELNEELQDEFEYCINSIEKYGGFYIGRYETGNLSKPKAKVVKGNTDIGSQTWYTMYKKCQQIVPNGNKNVRTSMIWGSLWDHTLNWLVTSGNKQYSDLTNSTSWGNYYNSTFQYQNASGNTVTKNSRSRTGIPSGSTEYTKSNNIYDMAGNVLDWTLEAGGTDCRANRGGYYSITGSDSPASSRGLSYPYNSYDLIRLACSTLCKVTLSPNSDAL